MLLALLGAEGATDHAWAMRHALSFLLPIDAARLVVALVEGGGEHGDDPRARVHWLRYGDAPLARIDDDMLLAMAASNACWRALCVLLEDVRAASPAWVTVHDDIITDVDGVRCNDNAWIQRATTPHRGTHYRFGHDVSKAVAARGDLLTLQWLWPRSAKTSGQVEPTRRASGGVDEHHARVEAVMEAAADARHFHIIEWVTQTSSLVHCVMPYDAELEAVCWIMRPIHDPRCCVYYCATKKYGYRQAESQATVSDDGMTNAGTTEMSLADPFARDGDLDTLKKIFARPNYLQLIGTNSITLAAQYGHFEVVKWLVAVLPKHSLLESFRAAAGGGHLPILEWLHREHSVAISFDAAVEAAKHGHVHVLRWLRSTYPLYHDTWALSSACQHGCLHAVAFLHEDCGTPLDMRHLSGSLTHSPNIETIDYVLDRLEPLPQPNELLQQAVQAGHAHVVKHLVINHSMWSRQAFSAVVAWGDPSSALEMSQFLYAQAQERARHLQTTLEDQIDLTRVTVAVVKHIVVAEWLLQSVPAVRVTSQFLASSLLEHGTKQVSRSILAACIKYRPEECHGIPWLPLWAVRANNFEALGLLKQSSHPHARDADTFHAVTTHTSDARFMLKLLPLPDDEPKLRQDVVEWAAKYGMVTVLDRVFDHEDDPRIQHQLLKRVAHHVGVSGHVLMADWVVRRCSTLSISTTTAFKDVAMEAVCHGHVHVLEWLRVHLHQLIPTRPQVIEKLVTAAGNARQVRSLQWLFLTMEGDIQPKWIARVLVEAVRQNRAEVVEFITRTFEPDAVPVGDVDRRRIRVYLEKIQPGHRKGVLAAAVSPPSLLEATTSGRRAKRSRRQ